MPDHFNLPAPFLRLFDAELVENQHVTYLTDHAGKRYFVLQGIPILLNEPYPYLIHLRDSIEEQLHQLNSYLQGDASNLWWVEAQRERLQQRLRAIYHALAQVDIPVSFKRTTDSQLDSRYETELNTDVYTHIGWSYLDDRPDAGDLYKVQQQLMETYLPANGIAVDLGCGVGRNVYNAAQIAEHGLAIGLDLSFSKLDRARAIVGESAPLTYPNAYRHAIEKSTLIGLGKRNATFALGNAGKLVFPTAVADCVTCAFVIGVVSSPHALLREALRILKPSGVLILADSLDGSGQVRFTLPRLIDLLNQQFGLKPIDQRQCTYLERISYTRTVEFITDVVVVRKGN